MRMNYISKIQTSLKRYQTIYTRRKTNRVLDGSYRSVFKGRSMNFDELREYVPGDDIKDMDWKASARSRKLLVRQYVAEKKHNIMLVMDTNRRMLGDSEHLVEKRELALMSSGTLAYLVNNNGDYISATFATEKAIDHYPFKTGLGNIETILEQYHKAVTMNNRSDLNVPLDYILRHFNRKMILIVASDLEGIRRISDVNLKRLVVMHDVLFFLTSDADLTGKHLYSLDRQRELPPFLAESRRFKKRVAARKMQETQACMERLKSLGISCSIVDDLEELDEEIINLLDRHKADKK